MATLLRNKREFRCPTSFHPDDYYDEEYYYNFDWVCRSPNDEVEVDCMICGFEGDFAFDITAIRFCDEKGETVTEWSRYQPKSPLEDRNGITLGKLEALFLPWVKSVWKEHEYDVLQEERRWAMTP